MEEHIVQTVVVPEENIFKNIPVEYDVECYYCDKADEMYEDERQISLNGIAMKNAYREKMGLLTSYQIAAIRARYGISQSDLCLLLGWGAKTITRYESHQVQDIAHDTILRKLDSDPEWFLQLLHAEKESLSAASYAKYMETGTLLFEQDHDLYLKSAILSKYARFLHNPEATGGKALSLDVVVDMIHYYANSSMVTSLYRVKLMKMLWYADSLSYKRYGHAISGMVYRALPMGAVPLAYESIVDLSAIHCEEIEMGDGTAYRFLPTEDKEYPHLTTEDMEVLDAVIQRFGKASKNEIVDTMHQEDAYIETAPYDIIQFKYAKALSLS
jgi:putative zinc finger/helix-turn-helix YgiT family protein